MKIQFNFLPLGIIKVFSCDALDLKTKMCKCKVLEKCLYIRLTLILKMSSYRTSTISKFFHIDCRCKMVNVGGVLN